MNSKSILVLFCCVFNASAGEKLVVGYGGTPWPAIMERFSKLSISRDSIWTWQVREGENIAPEVLARGGHVFSTEKVTDSFGRTTLGFSIHESMGKAFDGDENTAFNPDEIGLSRHSSLYIDLGGHFGVQQIRFFPRLDKEHRDLYLQAFALGSDKKSPSRFAPIGGIALEPFGSPFLIYANQNSPNTQSVVIWPLPNQPRDDKEMRHIRIETLNERPWEIAEIEVIANGNVARAEFISQPISVPGGFPVWGRVRINGQPLDAFPIILQTRTGPDPNPLQYFLRLTKSQTLREVTKLGWQNIVTLSDVERGEAEQGPVLPNPEWSAWEAVTDGQIISPSPKEYIQFRVLWNEPGMKIETIEFDYTSWPLAQNIKAEIDPQVSNPGEETEFVLSILVNAEENSNIPTSGFRRLRIGTVAEIVGVDRVLVKDREAFFTTRLGDSQGFDIELWDRIDPSASFIEIFFRARIFADGTSFRVQAIDERATVTEREMIYQFAQIADVDPRSPGSTLSVRLEPRNSPLVDTFRTSSEIFSPNGDEVNDELLISYNLLRLTRPAPVAFDIFDLLGNRIQRGFAGSDNSGRFLRIWDGRDRYGKVVQPGFYVYQLKVEADAADYYRQGVVSVVH